MDYSKMQKAQLVEEIEALQGSIAELEIAETERKRAKEPPSFHQAARLLIPSSNFPRIIR